MLQSNGFFHASYLYVVWEICWGSVWRRLLQQGLHQRLWSVWRELHCVCCHHPKKWAKGRHKSQAEPCNWKVEITRKVFHCSWCSTYIKVQTYQHNYLVNCQNRIMNFLKWPADEQSREQQTWSEVRKWGPLMTCLRSDNIVILCAGCRQLLLG